MFPVVKNFQAGQIFSTRNSKILNQIPFKNNFPVKNKFQPEKISTNSKIENPKEMEAQSLNLKGSKLGAYTDPTARTNRRKYT